jgi:hypothetical protein
MLVDRKGLSERRACQIVGQHRSTQRREPCVAGLLGMEPTGIEPVTSCLQIRLRRRSLARIGQQWLN